MDHTEAVQTQAIEKYLLGEFSVAEQDEFAEHYFGCAECASDLRLTSSFLDTTRDVLAQDRQIVPSKQALRNNAKWWNLEWLPAPYALAASLVFLAILLYQNTVMIPHLRNSAAPQALASISLANLGSRGAAETAIHPPQGKPYILLLDIPNREQSSDYRCDILNQRGDKVVSVDVAEALADRTVPVLVPAAALAPGSYTLVVSGRAKGESASYNELERYPFQVM